MKKLSILLIIAVFSLVLTIPDAEAQFGDALKKVKEAGETAEKKAEETKKKAGKNTKKAKDVTKKAMDKKKKLADIAKMELTVKETKGKPRYKKAGQKKWTILTNHMKVKSKDQIKTDKKSSVVLEIPGGKTISIKPNTVISVDKLIKKQKKALKQCKDKIKDAKKKLKEAKKDNDTDKEDSALDKAKAEKEKAEKEAKESLKNKLGK